MGLMDKFKNLFTDEEIIEEDEFEEEEEPIKIKEIKKEEPPKKEENKLPTFMREKIEKEEHQEKKVSDDFVPDFSMTREMNRELHQQPLPPKRESSQVEPQVKAPQGNNFKFPIDFEDSDFSTVSRVSRQARKNNTAVSSRPNPTLEPKNEKMQQAKKNPKKEETKVSKLYKDKKKKPEEDKKFIATPIISPIYGVLDKNYRTEELPPINEESYEMHRPSKVVDFDSVRKKAYGSLTEDIKENLMCENCEYLKKAKACKKASNKDNLMYEALCEKDDEVEENTYIKEEKRQPKIEDITLDEATENYFDYGVEYQKATPPETEEKNVKIVNNVEKETHPKKKHDVPPVKSNINLLSTLKKSMGDESSSKDNSTTPKQKDKDLELTDDLFNLIDSMYDEGKE